ncbi:glycosyltransferase involved in cell wall biosynthesis [Croceifilum oryzae]|uniref:Glycosyltransferase involved in cell wall biosynthesis n=1 Tax=Croceifilum oryzae TaxID=1553429 RepID=A0AAJ1TDE7_9BACL|nr:glycosyltransferase family 4 protein [Croceifilum oryzae]MDQ0416855.1 glycosyltransferase involved in cell wall biosynthesis [Croceifilum oryzae]
MEIVIPNNAPIHYPIPCKITRVPEISRQYIPQGDIILANYYKTFEACYEAWPQQCVRYTMGYEPHYVPDKEYAISLYQKKVPTITISRWLQNNLWKDTAQISTIISPGLDLNIYKPREKKSIRPREMRKILYIARNPAAQIKGYHDFIESMEIVKRKSKVPFKVFFICPEKNIIPTHIPHKCFRPVSEHAMADLYQKADLFVSTSWVEGFSLPPLEAMACGTPVVTTNSGGVTDFCIQKRTAVLVKKQNPQSIANGILSVLHNQKLANQLAFHGLQMAQKFSLEQFTQSMIRTFQEIIATRQSANY